MEDSFQFDDDTVTNEPPKGAPAGAQGSSTGSQGFSSGSRQNFGDREYAKEVYSESIHAKFRTFYVDLKKSGNGFFVKISEKSHGRKSTIMMDAEDVKPMIEALQKVQAKLQ